MPSNIIYLVCHSAEMAFSNRYASLYDEFCDGLLTRRVTVIDGTPYKTTRQSPDHPTFGKLHYFGYLTNWICQKLKQSPQQNLKLCGNKPLRFERRNRQQRNCRKASKDA